MPAETPETTPDAFMVATAVLLLVQVPPVAPFDVNVVVPVVRIVVVPEIVPALGKALTVTVELVAEEQPLADTL